MLERPMRHILASELWIFRDLGINFPKIMCQDISLPTPLIFYLTNPIECYRTNFFRSKEELTTVYNDYLSSFDTLKSNVCYKNCSAPPQISDGQIYIFWCSNIPTARLRLSLGLTKPQIYEMKRNLVHNWRARSLSSKHISKLLFVGCVDTRYKSSDDRAVALHTSAGHHILYSDLL